MKKRDLMEFINLVEAKALKSVSKRHNKIIEDAKEKLFEDNGFNRRISAIQKQLNSMREEVGNLFLDMYENKEINHPRNHYDGLLSRLNEYSGGTSLKEKILKDSSFSGGQIPLLIKAKEQEMSDVSTQYGKVRYVSNSKTSAKDIAQYLEEVGFDISSVRKGDDCVALSVELDKSKLFVCGENK